LKISHYFFINPIIESSIYVSVKNNANPIVTRVEVIKENINDFISIYQSVNVTPYIHAFGQHLGEMIKLHGDVNI